ncbi:hypothetical protein M9H77_09949 [Catharanthus roseus]|uniref:Uncharacterized protein n=1 Tax=Catharanthus roseus TaxID=4058 RepID=A0ACC0C282_CATRO|nr:hypothetical protein M9H77_09949 [Catharanthus roseus]
MSPKAEVHVEFKQKATKYQKMKFMIPKNKTKPKLNETMSGFTNSTAIFINPHYKIAQGQTHRQHWRLLPKIQAKLESYEQKTNLRRTILSTFLTTSAAAAAGGLGLNYGGGSPKEALAAEKWGTRSFALEKILEPELSPEDSVTRIRQTADGLHTLREMLENMSWRYILFYIRVKQSYLSKDMTNAIPMVPLAQRDNYVTTANQLVDNMAEFDRYIRTPKIYESYLYYEKTLQSIDDLVGFLP